MMDYYNLNRKEFHPATSHPSIIPRPGCFPLGVQSRKGFRSLVGAHGFHQPTLSVKQTLCPNPGKPRRKGLGRGEASVPYTWLIDDP
jgi:hypothetical protein